MNRKKTENFIILLVTLSCIGLTVESYIMGWEFWVPPLIVIGAVMLWVMIISEKPDEKLRRLFYLAYAMLTVFFHGVHGTSFFDVSVVIVLVMVAYSFFDRVYMMNIILSEYAVIIGMQILFLQDGSVFSDALDISRIILQ